MMRVFFFFFRSKFMCVHDLFFERMDGNIWLDNPGLREFKYCFLIWSSLLRWIVWVQQNKLLKLYFHVNYSILALFLNHQNSWKVTDIEINMICLSLHACIPMFLFLRYMPFVIGSKISFFLELISMVTDKCF